MDRPMAELFLEVKNITKTFIGVKALDNVDLSIGKGEIHCLVGENGSGKSTLIKIIGGVYKPDSGTITLDGTEYKSINAIESIRAGVQIIYQDLSLFPNMTVAENIAMNQMLVSNNRVINWKHMHQDARKALEEIGEDIDLYEKVENLSIARRQIVAICRALTQNARLIIMDEATSAITKDEVEHLFEVIAKLQKKGIAILFVSHKLNEVFQIAERVTIIKDAKKVGVYPASELNNDKMVFLMTGQNFKAEPYRYNGTSEPVLSVHDLNKTGQFSGISFDLKKGEILGITGLLGSGRTEIALSLFGLNRLDSGEIRVNGKPLDIRSPRDAIAAGIAYLPEDRLTQGLFAAHTVGNNIIITVLNELLNRFKILVRSRQEDEKKSWIKKLNIKTPGHHSSASSLSGGNQQRVVIAKWLATKPAVFILDGPTIGIDIGSKHNIHEIIRDLARNGMSIIMISDEIPEILDNCNRVLVMAEGRIIKEIKDSTKVNEEELLDIVSSRNFVQGAAG
ncbi:MAG: sugar ABC transporter ATP-binding protein [Treponema sp.]|jgi:simple sugar transport system ATP-binding protein|nr:sugar ABC transporter ATP-binding protein [Treponema sp.]